MKNTYQELVEQEIKSKSAQSTLQRIDEIKDSKTFLEQCTYFIGLSDLYQFHSTCYYNETMIYSPVQARIVHPDIKECYQGANFLLQVWKKGGKKVFEKTLQDQVEIWSICYQYFIYKPSQKDENHEYFHIIDLANDSKTYLIRDFVQDPSYKFIAIANNMLYVANHNQIKVVSVNLQNNNDPITFSTEDIFNIHLENEGDSNIPCKLLGLIIHKYTDAETTSVLACIESSQSIVDFSFLNVQKSQSLNADNGYTYTLNQFREIILQKGVSNVSNDRIVSFDFVVMAKNQFVVACAQKESGNFDIYYNAFRVSQSEKVTINGFQLSFDTLYLQMSVDRIEIKEEVEEGKFETRIAYVHTPEGKNRVRAINYTWENKMNYDNSEYDEHYTLKSKHFTSYNLLGTVLALSHGRMVSIYSVLSAKWIKHFTFEKEVTSMFRSTIALGQVTILLSDNTIKIIKADRRAQAQTSNDQEVWIEDRSIKVVLPPGKITRFACDYEDNEWILFLHKNEGKCSLLALIANKLFDISSQIDKFGEKTNIFFLYSVSDKTEFILQYNKRIKLYEISMEEDIPEEERKRREEAKDQVINDDDPEAVEKAKKEAEQPKKVYEKKPVAVAKAIFKVPELKAQLQFGVKFRLHEAHQEDDDDKGSKHSDPEYLIVGDYHNLYNIDLQTLKCKNVFQDANIIGIYFSDNNYLYTLSHRSGQKKSGFRLYDIENVVERGRDYSYLLTSNVQVGCQGYIDYSPSNNRIVFQASFEKIEIIPLLHRNTMSFIGMKPRHLFLATKIIDGKFYAMTIKGQLFGWDMVTGKMLHSENTPVFPQYADYDIYQWDKEKVKDQVYQKEWYNKILLKKKTPIENFDENAYFGNARAHAIRNQVSYIDKQPKQFFEFKLIEIVSDREVKEHFHFVHPFYNNMMQYIFFSSDLTYMYERLKYERQFLYQRKDMPDGSVQWFYVHRFNQLPMDLLHVTSYPFIFSPDFTKYIDIDNTHSYFIIRDTLNNEEEISQIPTQLINPKEQDPEQIARKFKWVDNDTFQVINDEGLERLIDIKNKFREINFNCIPLYDPEIAQKHHYLLDQPSFQESDTLKRLQRKYQDYKSAYYLWNRRDPKTKKILPYHLQQSLFNVDYRINECKGRYSTDMSFTFLHWSLIEQLGSGKIQVDQIDLEQIEHLFFNILPGGNTILHLLHDKGELLEKLMRIANFRDEKPEMVIHVPFIQNMEEKSPIHLCSKAQEYRYINMFLEYLQNYPIDHHSRAIADEYHIMIKHSLPNFIPYLDSRVKQTKSIASITKGMLKETNKNHVCVASYWHSQEDIDQLLQPAPIEQDIKLSFLDVPLVHNFVSNVGQNVFGELADTEDMRLFDTKGVRKLIEFKWPLIFEYTVKKLFIPFIIYLALYLSLMHKIFYMEEMNAIGYIVQVGVVLLSFYLLGIEVYQVSCAGPSYFLSFWNYLDIIPPILLLIFLGLFNANFFINQQKTANIEASLQASISLLLWLKMLYFLRIFKTTGYLIRIIIEVVLDMRNFLFILLLTFVAFGDAMYNINTSNKPEDEFIDNGYIGGIFFVYRMVLGDFETDKFGQVAVSYMWILFLLCTVLNMIIMLNLLIAIISESFARINAEKEQAGYQEKATFIAENHYLIPKSRCESYCLENRYLLFAVDVEEELNEHEETVDQKLEKLKEAILSQNKKQLKKIKEKINQNQEEILKILKPAAVGPDGQPAEGGNPHQH